MINKIENITFSRRLFTMHSIERFIVRIISYSFSIFCIGLIIAFFISDIKNLNWAGALLLLMYVDYIFHVKKAHFSLTDFFNERVPNNNIALCIDRTTTQILLSSLDLSMVRNADLDICLLDKLVNNQRIIRALERLEIDHIQFKERCQKAVEDSAKSGTNHVLNSNIERIKEICIGAAIYAETNRNETISVTGIFSAIAKSNHPAVMRLLDFYAVSPMDVDVALVFGEHSSRDVSPYLGGFAMRQSRVSLHRVNRSFTSRPTPFLDQFAIDITDYVRDGYGGFLIGHMEEFNRMLDILSKPGQRNVFLVGEVGVGKEALVHYLAYQIVADAVPGPLFDRRVVQISLADMLSVSGQENIIVRMQKISEEIIKAGNILLYIPDAHLLEKNSGDGGVSLGDIFAPILRSGAFPVIAATHPREYSQFIDSKPAFADAFELIRVKEISEEDASQLLSYSALILERKYKIKISCSAIARCVSLAAKYIRNKLLPSSAQELLQEVVVDCVQHREPWVKAEHVINILERKLNVPIRVASGIEASELLKLEDTIHKSYVDQDEAVSAVARSLRSYRSGLGRKDGPISSFLFVGPTGVGKTELTKILARLYFGSESFLIRFDMSEYQEKSSIVRFIGSPDGKMAGQLTEAISHQPYSVLLLDEFEKANPDILNLFLQVFDDGRLTDNTGRAVDFRNTIIIATSNAHSTLVQQHVQQHGDIEGFADELKKRLSEYFRPELINRFSDIIVFKPLSRDDFKKIVSIQISSLAKQISESQGITISLSDNAKDKIAHVGYDPAFGARPLRRALDVYIKAPLSEKILGDEIHRGDVVEVNLGEDGKFVFLKK